VDELDIWKHRIKIGRLMTAREQIHDWISAAGRMSFRSVSSVQEVRVLVTSLESLGVPSEAQVQRSGHGKGPKRVLLMCNTFTYAS